LIDGGTADLFWGFIVVAIGMSLVYASLAEMASMCVTVLVLSRTYTEGVFQVPYGWRAIPLGFGVCASQDPEASELHSWWVSPLLFQLIYS